MSRTPTFEKTLYYNALSFMFCYRQLYVTIWLQVFGFRDPDPLVFMDPNPDFIFFCQNSEYLGDVALGKYTLLRKSTILEQET